MAAASAKEEYKVPVGADIGTSTTVIQYIPQGSSVPITIKNECGGGLHPTVIYYNPDPTKPNLFGQAALNMLGSKTSGNVITCPKRALGVTSNKLISNNLHLSFNAKMSTTGAAHPKFIIKQKEGDGFKDIVVSSQQVMTDLLLYFKGLIEKELGAAKMGIVFTMPEQWLTSSVNAFKAALRGAGFKYLQLITEPAGTQFAYRAVVPSEKKAFLVGDLGCGTLDLSLLQEVSLGEYKTMAVGGSELLGSKNIDIRFLETLEEEMKRDPSFSAEEFDKQKPKLLIQMTEMKLKLSQNEEAEEMVYGVCSKGFNFHVTREKKMVIIKPFLQKFERLVNEVFEKAAKACGGLWTADQMKQSTDIIYLAGGGMGDPVFGDKIFPAILPNAEIVGKRGVAGSLNPHEVVSCGATYWAASQMRVPLRFGLPMDASHMRILSRDIGIEGITTDTETGEDIKWFNVLIKACTEIPTSHARRYTTSRINQPNILINVFQGEGQFTTDDDVHLIGSYTVPLKVPNVMDGAKITVVFELGNDNVLTVRAGGEGEPMKELKINVE